MISQEIRERFVRDDLPHRLGALAANLLRVETFCKRPGSLELAKRVMEESKAFVEWSARNASVDVASELRVLQREASLWLRRWPTITIDPIIEEEMAPWAKKWADRVLAMSGLSDSSGIVSPRAPVIPDGHKFTVIALASVWHGIEVVVTASGSFVRPAPLKLDEFWIRSKGELWATAVREADLFLVSTQASANGDLDHEAEANSNRSDLMRHGLALASRHFRCGIGQILIGNHRGGRLSIQSVGETPKLLRHPDATSIQLTEPDFLRAARFATQLFAPFMTTDHKLKMSVESFMDGMQARKAVERIHCFVRSIEGVIRPRKSSTQRDFVASVQSVLKSDHRAELDEMFRIRSAHEHLNDPMEEIAGPGDVEKVQVLFLRAAEAEAIARAFLTRVLERAALFERRFPADSTALTPWSDEDRKLWDVPLDLNLEVRDMTTRS